MLPVKNFIDFIEKNILFDRGSSILAAVSGGMDSVVMVHLLKAAGYNFAIAHCNFQLRGDDALGDQQFVQDLADEFGVKFHTINFDTKRYAAEKKISIQMAARELRYQWFAQISRKSGYDVTALAHHQNDAIETVYGGTFQQKYSTLTSDSAYVYQAQSTFDAFGHVVITQGDTLHVYSDKLNYNDKTKIAILTENVRMVDKDATLTTNYLTYNTATKFGTYTDGGKLVNKDNTLTSKNGYYFANSRDSYFRYDVVLLSPDAITKTDTLRYNTGSKIAYFYGPTHIYGKKKDNEKGNGKAKDNDTLYTENGYYNTVTEQALFGKKNLYSQGAKTLKGDSMFYDRKKGYGRVVKNITFNDNEQKMTLKGNLGTFFKSDERTVVTENAYGIIVTEEKDTSKKRLDSSKDEH